MTTANRGRSGLLFHSQCVLRTGVPVLSPRKCHIMVGMLRDMRRLTLGGGGTVSPHDVAGSTRMENQM